jgi:hypothetical protein
MPRLLTFIFPFVIIKVNYAYSDKIKNIQKKIRIQMKSTCDLIVQKQLLLTVWYFFKQ